eukprot:scaffold14008_cov20-Tisochrysis_lutea.AAC.1
MLQLFGGSQLQSLWKCIPAPPALFCIDGVQQIVEQTQGAGQDMLAMTRASLSSIEDRWLGGQVGKDRWAGGHVN